MEQKPWHWCGISSRDPQVGVGSQDSPQFVTELQCLCVGVSILPVAGGRIETSTPVDIPALLRLLLDPQHVKQTKGLPRRRPEEADSVCV